MPTWYTIRANKDGYIARKKEIDLLIAMNAETAQDDVKTLAPGAAVLYDEPLALDKVRDDLTYYAVPFDKLAATVGAEAKLRKLIKNMIYVGVAAQLLEIDYAEVEKAIRKQFATKVKAATLNLAAAKAGYDYAAANLKKRDPYLHPAHGQDEGQDHCRRQFRRGDGLHVCRMHGGDVVSDYAVVVAGRDDDRLHEGIPHRAGWQGDVCHRAGGRRTGGGRHGDRRGLGGRALDDGDRRAGHFADGGVYRARVLRRSSGGDLGHSARRAVDRLADSYFAGRRAFDGISEPRRHQAHHAVSEFGQRVLHDGAGCLRFGGALSDAGVRHVGPRSRHE